MGQEQLGRQARSPLPARRPARFGAALAQSHLRQVLLSGSLSAFLFGGEIYITYKAGLIDDHGNVTDEGTQKFLQGFVDGFALS